MLRQSQKVAFRRCMMVNRILRWVYAKDIDQIWRAKQNYPSSSSFWTMKRWSTTCGYKEDSRLLDTKSTLQKWHNTWTRQSSRRQTLSMKRLYSAFNASGPRMNFKRHFTIDLIFIRRIGRIFQKILDGRSAVISYSTQSRLTIINSKLYHLVRLQWRQTWKIKSIIYINNVSWRLWIRRAW